MNKNKNLFEEFENVLEEYFEMEKTNLKSNKKYNELKIKRHNILAKNRNLSSILEGEIDNLSLTNDEYYSLYELIKIGYDMQEIENKKLFFLGGKLCIFY